MKLLIASLALTFSFAASAAELHIIKDPGMYYGSDAEHFKIGESEAIVPGTLEVARCLESLQSGGEFDAEFSKMNGNYYVFSIKDCAKK